MHMTADREGSGWLALIVTVHRGIANRRCAAWLSRYAGAYRGDEPTIGLDYYGRVFQMFRAAPVSDACAPFTLHSYDRFRLAPLQMGACVKHERRRWIHLRISSAGGRCSHNLQPLLFADDGDADLQRVLVHGPEVKSCDGGREVPRPVRYGSLHPAWPGLQQEGVLV